MDIFSAIRLCSTLSTNDLSILENQLTTTITVDGDEYTPIRYAAYKKKWRIVEQIAKAYETDEQDTALYCSALLRDLRDNQGKLAELLIQKGAKVNWYDLKTVNRSLHYACMNDQTDIALLILEKDPTLLNVKNKDGKTPFELYFEKHKNHDLSAFTAYNTEFTMIAAKILKEDEFKTCMQKSWQGDVKFLLQQPEQAESHPLTIIAVHQPIFYNQFVKEHFDEIDKQILVKTYEVCDTHPFVLAANRYENDEDVMAFIQSFNVEQLSYLLLSKMHSVFTALSLHLEDETMIAQQIVPYLFAQFSKAKPTISYAFYHDIAQRKHKLGHYIPKELLQDIDAKAAMSLQIALLQDQPLTNQQLFEALTKLLEPKASNMPVVNQYTHAPRNNSEIDLSQQLDASDKSNKEIDLSKESVTIGDVQYVYKPNKPKVENVVYYDFTELGHKIYQLKILLVSLKGLCEKADTKFAEISDEDIKFLRDVYKAHAKEPALEEFWSVLRTTATLKNLFDKADKHLQQTNTLTTTTTSSSASRYQPAKSDEQQNQMIVYQKMGGNHTPK